MPTKVEHVNLVYRGEIIRTVRLSADNDIKEWIYKWLKAIKPALKRGEKVIIEIELIGS